MGLNETLYTEVDFDQVTSANFWSDWFLPEATNFDDVS